MKIHDAILAFQKKGVKIGKNAANPHFKSKYADLSNIIETINPIISEIGISVTHRVVAGELVTTLHTDEDATDSCFPLFGTKPQEFGSSITYAKRYNLGALLNLDIDDDDDGNAANTAQKTAFAKNEGSALMDAIKAIEECSTLEDLKDAYESAKGIATTEKQKKWVNDVTQKIKDSLTNA